MSSEKAILALADGSSFLGRSLGVSGEVSGEVVFNTSLTGYQEILTDPSYAKQIVTLTYPHIGNTGTNLEDMESEKIDNYMTKKPETLTKNDPISYALNKMHIYGIRHIPILNDNGKIHGMISVKDIISHLGNYFGAQIANLPPDPSQHVLDRPEGG